jgi:hypothetical protein
MSPERRAQLRADYLDHFHVEDREIQTLARIIGALQTCRIKDLTLLASFERDQKAATLRRTVWLRKLAGLKNSQRVFDRRAATGGLEAASPG